MNTSAAFVFNIFNIMAGLVGSFKAYDLKSDEWSTYKGRLEFYFHINKITDATMRRAALLTLIGNAGFRMLTNLHFPTKLIDVTYDALFENLDKVYDRKVSKITSRVRFGTVSSTKAKASTNSSPSFDMH